MSESWTPSDELQTLAAAAFCGELPEEGLGRLELILSDSRACRWYRDLCLLQAELRILATADRANAAAQECVRREARALALPIVDISPCPQPSPSVPYAPIGTLGNAAQNAAGFFSHGWPLAYLVAVMVLGFGLLIGSFMPASLSPRTQIATQPSLPSDSDVAPKMNFVGRITGMVDCRWADESTAAFNGAHVPLGRSYALASGLMEITYDSGAKVILQGPCTYEVESAAGGFLSVGKLTARVEKREGKSKDQERSTEYEVRSRNQTAAHSDVLRTPYSVPPAGPSPLTSLPSPLFAVRTPTATVTDLGTEFGVEVTKEGNTTSHVFRGSVEVRAMFVTGGSQAAVRVLHANESAQVVTPTVEQQSSASEIRPIQVDAQQFVRQMPYETSATTKTLPMKVVAWYRLGEDDPDAVVGEKVATKTANHNGYYHLAPRTKPTYSDNVAPGGSSMSVRFDGAQNECVVNTHVPYLMTEEFVLEAWVCPQKIEKYFQFIAYNGEPNCNGYGLLVGDGRWQFLLGRVRMVDSGVSCEVGKWTHVALVCERNKAQLWINGKPAGRPFSGQPTLPDTSFSIGCDHRNNPSMAFVGEIDEVRLSQLSGRFSPEMLLFGSSTAQREKGEAGK